MPLRNHGALIGSATALILAILGALHYIGTLEGRIDSLNLKRINEAKVQALLEIRAAASGFVDGLPPGTIIASVLRPKLFMSDGREHKWRLADASSIPRGSKYWNVVQKMIAENDKSIARPHDRLPDLRGVFLRGLNSGRNDGKQDPDGEARLAGSYQSYGTKLPKTPFRGKTQESGRHKHRYTSSREYGAGPGDHARAKHDGPIVQTQESGQHRHQVTISSGGDDETRPANVSVYFYIKVN